MSFDLEFPGVLAALPLALLPLLRRSRESLPFSSLAFLPGDGAGRYLVWLRRALGVLTLSCIIVGLAGPGSAGARVARIGRGAEILILFDRSSSMDSVLTAAGAGAAPGGESKNGAARRLLTRFVARRPDDRFAFMAFGTSVMPVAPFSDHNQAVLAGLAATAVGRGLPDTNMGPALLAAIDQFRPRSYSGSRLIVLVSDGGAVLDESTRERIQAGLVRFRIGLDFVYLRNNVNSPNLDHVAADDPTDEAALHRFFSSLSTPYRLYQAEDSNALEAAIADIDRQQNLPLSFFVRVQRRDFSREFFALAASTCALLSLLGPLRLRAWT
jgi:mxaC protein